MSTIDADKHRFRGRGNRSPFRPSTPYSYSGDFLLPPSRRPAVPSFPFVATTIRHSSPSATT